MQTRRASFIESLLNVGSGFVISLLVWRFFIMPVFAIETSMSENLAITAIFTVVSVVRGYLWRRFFNRFSYNYNKKLLKETRDAPHRDPRQGSFW